MFYSALGSVLQSSRQSDPTLIHVLSGQKFLILLPQDVLANHLRHCSARCEGGLANPLHNHLLNPGLWFSNMLPQYWNDILYGQPAVKNVILNSGDVLFIPSGTVYSSYNLQETVAAVWK